MQFLTYGRLWKAIGCLLILGVAFWIPFVDTEYVRDTAMFVDEADVDSLEVTSGVRAAFYAMVAAAFVLVGLIPTGKPLNQEALANLGVQVMGGGSAFYAGWLWLSSETNNMPLPYILPMVIVGLIVAVGVGIQVGWVAADHLLRRRGGPALYRTLLAKRLPPVRTGPPPFRIPSHR